MPTLALRLPTGSRPGPRGPAVGLGISLLVHAAVLAALTWLLRHPSPRPAAEAPGAPIEVRLAPARPAPAAQRARPETSAAERPAVAPQTRPHARPAARTHAPTPGRETPEVETAPAARGDDAFAVPPPAADAAPAVDLAAARQAARQIAHEGGKGLVALPERKPVTDPNAGRPTPVDPIERARRPDCKTAYAGAGLLAVIPLVIDAVRDSGCKW